MTADTEREAPPIDTLIARQTMDPAPRRRTLADVLRVLNARCLACGATIPDDAPERCGHCGVHQ